MEADFEYGNRRMIVKRPPLAQFITWNITSKQMVAILV